MTGSTQHRRAQLYPAQPEVVPSGWAGPVAPTTQDCYKIGENGAGTDSSWGRAGNQSYTPSGRVIYYNATNTGGSLKTTGYAGGYIRLYAPAGSRSGNVRVVVTRVSTGQIIYDQIVQNYTGGGNTVFIMHEINLPLFAAWHVDILQTVGGMSLYDIIWG